MKIASNAIFPTHTERVSVQEGEKAADDTHRHHDDEDEDKENKDVC